VPAPCSLKIGSLLLRTLSKPIANKIKQRAKDHEGFKTRTVWLAQLMHRTEMNLRVSLLGESPKHIRPLSEARAIESGANFLSEGVSYKDSLDVSFVRRILRSGEGNERKLIWSSENSSCLQ